MKDRDPLSTFSNIPGRESWSRVRAEFVALPVAVMAAFLFRAGSFGTSMGPDELSLLIMRRSMVDGAFPYEIYWDPRAPLAYFIALPSAWLGDGFAALFTLRLLTVFVHAGAAWTLFCLFRRTLGVPGALVGTLFLLLSANMADLHQVAMPNHFVMGMSLAAFACLVAGIRGNRPAFFFSAILVGAMPWVMVQSGFVSLGLVALVLFVDASLRRTERLTWCLTTVFPTVAIIGTFFFWGPFDTFVRTVFLAPFQVIEAGMGKDWLHWETASELPDSTPWRVGYILVLIVGAALSPIAVRRSPPGSALRHAGFLVVPVSLGFFVTAMSRPLPSPEYFIDAAPAAALFAAIIASRLWRLERWRVFRESRWLLRNVLRVIAIGCLAVIVAFPFNPPKHTDAERLPLPQAYCDNAARWIKRLGPHQTILHLSGICGIQIFGTGRAFHPPFTYAGNWFRPNASWIGNAISGDGSQATAIARLRKALGRGSDVGVIVASGLLLDEIEARGWESFFYDEWRLVWYRFVPGHDAGFDRLAVFARADMLDRNGCPTRSVATERRR